jgi:hypothetical protein
VNMDGLEEEYWRKRSRLRWTLQGYACVAFFQNVRGVRQGDPLSRILFDFLVDSLAAIIVLRRRDIYMGWCPI